MTEPVQIPTTSACDQVGATHLETTERSWGTEHTVTCSCGYYRHWARSSAAEHDQMFHECDPEQVTTVGVVWLVSKSDGAVLLWAWTTTESVLAKDCAYCRSLGAKGLCPGVVAHTIDARAREVARLPLADVRAGVFPLSVRLGRMEVVTALQHHIEALAG